MTEPLVEADSGRLIYAASDTCADLLYACGFNASDPFIWYETPAACGIVVTALEFGRACKQVKPGIAVYKREDLRLEWDIAAGVSLTPEVMLAALFWKTGIGQWTVPDDFPFGLGQKLVAENDVNLQPKSDMFPERRCKTTVEIEYVREGVVLAEVGFAAGLQVLRESTITADGSLHWQEQALTAEILRGEINCAIVRRGGTASQTIAAPGPQGADPHQVGHGPIVAGAPIVMDIFPQVNATGYYGDFTRTLVKREASAVVKRAFAAVHEAQQAAIAAIKPGVLASELHNTAAEIMEAAGFRTDTTAEVPTGFIHGLGHGLGLEVHEMPRVSGRSDILLEPGNVVTIEPGLYYPEWGGVRLEDVIAVTADGAENLTSAEIFLEVE